VLVYKPGAKILVASSDGRGFVVAADDVLAQTRNGKQVMRPGKDSRALVATPAEGDTIAVVGENRKLLLFPLSEVPEMAGGRGVILQRYHQGGLADARVITKADGLSWKSGDRTRTETDLRAWTGNRAGSGRIAPRGFPADNRFS